MKRPKKNGLKIEVDATDLIKFANRAAKVESATTPLIADSLNKIGDGVVSIMAQRMQRQTGLELEKVLGLIKVERAERNDLEYEIRINQGLVEREFRTLEGQREVREFGTEDPEALVIIVSKEDELVCMECEVLAASGPMSIEIAKAHVPVHPNCRCVIVPYVQARRRLPVTMTSLSGTDPVRRAGVKPLLFDAEATLRQVAQSILDRTATTIRIQLG